MTVYEKGLNDDEDHSEFAEIELEGYTIIGGGEGNYGKVVQDNEGNWVYELTNTFEHAGQGTDTEYGADRVNITVQDANGVESTVAVKVNIVDDVPQSLELEEGSINEDFVGEIEFDAGNDGFGSLAFKNEVNGSPVLDTSGNQVQLNGEDLTYNVAEDGTLTAQTAGGDVAFKVTLEGDSQYIVTEVADGLGVATAEGAISTVSFVNDGENKPEDSKTFTSEGDGSQIVVTSNTGKVNGSNKGGSFALGSNGKGNSIDADNNLRFDFKESDGSASHVTEIQFDLTDMTGKKGPNKSVDVLFKLFDADGNPLAEAQEVSAIVNGESYDLTFTNDGWVLAFDHAPSKDVSVTLSSDTAFSNLTFSVDGDGAYRVRVPSSVTKGIHEDGVDEVCLDIPVVGSDGDGDTIDGNLPLTLDCSCDSDGGTQPPINPELNDPQATDGISTEGFEPFAMASFSLDGDGEDWDFETLNRNDEAEGEFSGSLMSLNLADVSGEESGDADISDLVSDDDQWVPGFEPDETTIQQSGSQESSSDATEDELVSGPSQIEIDQASDLVEKGNKSWDSSDGHH